MSALKCKRCKKEVDVNNGGCAIMLAFCRNHNTNLINVSFCADCYKKYVNSYIHMLDTNAKLGIVFGDEVKE